MNEKPYNVEVEFQKGCRIAAELRARGFEPVWVPKDGGGREGMSDELTSQTAANLRTLLSVAERTDLIVKAPTHRGTGRMLDREWAPAWAITLARVYPVIDAGTPAIAALVRRIGLGDLEAQEGLLAAERLGGSDAVVKLVVGLCVEAWDEEKGPCPVKPEKLLPTQEFPPFRY